MIVVPKKDLAVHYVQLIIIITSGYATMVHGRRCNPHCCTTTFAKPEITSFMTS